MKQVIKLAASPAINKKNITVDSDGFTLVENMKPKPLQSLYPQIERQVIVSHNIEVNISNLCPSAKNAIGLVDQSLLETKDIISPPFLLASFRPNNTLVLTTASSHRVVDYEAYLGIIKESLKKPKPVENICCTPKSGLGVQDVFRLGLAIC